MNEWKEYHFSDFVEINPTVSMKGTEQYSFVEMKDLQDGNKFCFPSAERNPSSGARFKEGDTLFARITPCLENGKICKVKGLKNGIGFGSTEFLVFRGKENVSDNEFVFYLSRWDEVRGYAESRFEGTSGRQRVPKNCFDNLFLKLPPLPEQTAIAEVLSSLDDKIDLLHRQNKTLEQLAETLFRQWFIEEAEECWEIGNVNDLVKIQSGFAFKSSDFSDDGIYRIITIKNVQDGFLDSSKSDFLNSIPRNMPEHCSLRIGDILLSLTGNVGRCCLVDNNNLLLNQRVAKLKQLNERDWAFTYIMFRQTSMRKTLEELAKGTAQANLSPIEMGSLDIQIPPANKLEHFSNEATPLIKKVLNNKIQIRTLTKLRDTLLPKLMSGEVRVNQINN